MTAMTERPERKSERTKGAILDAARRLFAERGYEGTTVRDIAAAASIDAALIVRYFGGKDELFAKAADVDLSLPDLAAIEKSRIGETLARHFFKIWAGPNGGGMVALLRSASSNRHAAVKMREIFTSQVLPALARTGAGHDFEDRAPLISAQILGFAFARYVLEIPALATMDEPQVVTTLGHLLQSTIEGA